MLSWLFSERHCTLPRGKLQFLVARAAVSSNSSNQLIIQPCNLLACNLACPAAGGERNTPTQHNPPCDTARGHPQGPSSSNKSGGTPTAAAAAAASAPSVRAAAAPPCKPAEVAAAYCAALRPHQFVERPLVVDHYFRCGGGGRRWWRRWWCVYVSRRLFKEA
eukprot:634826-Pelagomonas_calceolata.AAC.1